MRIIAGSARGRKLKTPEGSEVRPTTDRVKESIFNIIQFDIEGRRVLDLFSGSGQMGIESLSRGAEHATFSDGRPLSVKLTRENLESVGFSDRSRVVPADYKQFLKTAQEKYDQIGRAHV